MKLHVPCSLDYKVLTSFHSDKTMRSVEVVKTIWRPYALLAVTENQRIGVAKLTVTDIDALILLPRRIGQRERGNMPKLNSCEALAPSYLRRVRKLSSTFAVLVTVVESRFRK